MPFNREVLRLRGSISRDMPWEVMPDLFFYRDPEEAEKEEAARAEEVMASMICIHDFLTIAIQVIASKQADFVAPPAKEEWGGEELASAAAPVTDWSADGAPAPAAAPAAPAAAAPAFQGPRDPTSDSIVEINNTPKT